jgi:hypothetical protein
MQSSTEIGAICLNTKNHAVGEMVHAEHRAGVEIISGMRE